MESNDFDELFAQASQIARFFSATYKDLTGEDLDLDALVRHYPVVALGLATGVGLVGGWWAGRRSRPQLPPPKPQTQPVSGLGQILQFGAQLRKDASAPSPGQPQTPLDFLERLVPGSAETVRHLLPEVNPEEASDAAKDWVDTVLEPKLKQGREFLEQASSGRAAAFFRQALQALAPEDGKEIQLEDDDTPTA